MSICFECRYFKQTAELEFTVSGYCNWKSPDKLPEWLKRYVESTDQYYGPKREVGKRYSGYEVKSCDAFEQTDDIVIQKRKSENWYEESNQYYVNGKNDHAKGYRLRDNPYDPDDEAEEHKQWNAGFRAANELMWGNILDTPCS